MDTELNSVARIGKGQHPDTRVVRAYSARFGAAKRIGMSDGDAHESAIIEARRVARELTPRG